jgi:hypothetical protein
MREIDCDHSRNLKMLPSRNCDNSRNWVDALSIIQAKKNERLHRGIGRTSYAMFGRDMKVGISNEQIRIC